MNLGESDIDFLPTACRRRTVLRRLRAGELGDGEAQSQRAHLDGCAQCQATWRELESEDVEVRAQVPFEKLQQRLEKPVAEVIPLRRRVTRALPAVGLALAAGLAAIIIAPRLTTPPENRTKGGLALDVFVGGVGEPRRVDSPAVALNPGERVQLKVHGNGHRFVAVVSVDEQGEVSPLFFEHQESLQLESSTELLPQSIDFDGRGRERLIVLFSDSPLGREKVLQSAHDAFARAGSLEAMRPLGLDGAEELDRTVLKPEGR